MKPSVQALYVRLPNWVGDVCMTLPCLEGLLACGLPVTVCARPWARDLLAAYPLANFVAMRGAWRADRAAVQIARKQARQTRAAGLLLPDSLSSALVFRFAGIPCAGYRDDGRSLILRWPYPKPGGTLHAVQQWYHLTRRALTGWHLPAPEPLPPDSLHWKAATAHHNEAVTAIASFFAQRHPKDRPAAAIPPFVLIAPTAVGLHKGRVKVWTGFDSLTRSLQARGVPVLMAPPAAEQQAARRAAPTADCLPPLSLGAFAALTRRAALVVCNDSGVSHLAAAAQARQITLFGVTSPQRTGPWSNRALRLGRPGQWPSTTEVLSAALSILEPNSAA